MKATALVENTACGDAFGAEHGLSLYIETKGHTILFDMGQTTLFEQNAALLGVDLSSVDFAVLSHGHYDHGGGLSRFLALNDHAPVYLSRRAFGQHYNGERYIGLDPALQTSDRLILTNEKAEITQGITLFSCNDRETVQPIDSAGLTRIEDGIPTPDDFRHEQYLLIEEDGKRVLISGCSHKGILNIVSWFRPDVLIGGFHFMKLPLDETLRRYAEALEDTETEFYTCHCTGEAQYAFMQRYMSRLHYLSAGQQIIL